MLKKIMGVLLFICLGIGFILFYRSDYFPIEKYENEDFGLEPFISLTDKDNDGIDNNTDILQGVRNYLETKPKYKSKYYGTGYPDDNYGVCTDVVAFGLLNAGYDLKELVNQDVLNYPERYDIDIVDSNIDFRRVNNLLPYFEHNALSLNTDLNDIECWQGGDIVVFKKHIGIVSNYRNKNGVPLLIHHANPYQYRYEENVLESYKDQIVGHFRMEDTNE